MNRAVVVQAKRTVIGKKGGILADYPAEKLAAPLIKTLGQNLPQPIDDILLGNIVGPGGNMARLTALESGLNPSAPGLTIDRQCGSGLEAIRLAAYLIQGDAGNIYMAGGVESTSTSPFKKRARFSPANIGDPDMGPAADLTAQKYGITRQMQDDYAYLSYQRTIQAQQAGYFEDEKIHLKNLPEKDEALNLKMDYARLLKRLSPCFLDKGTITLGNCCGINDGASVALLMSEKMAHQAGYKPVLTFVDSALVAVDPRYPILGASSAISKLLDKCNLKTEDIDLFEINESFAAKIVLAANRLNIPYEKINVHGGAIALGHPYGASGALLVTRLYHLAKYRQAKYAISAIGIGGGQGMAILWEMSHEN